MTPPASTTRSPRSRAAKDTHLTSAEAIHAARDAAAEIAEGSRIGEHLGAVCEAERVVTHYFACTEFGYRDWRWAVTISRAPRSKKVTISEAELLPGEGALLAPPWVPWVDRLRPGDMGSNDVLPYRYDDPRLEQGFEVTGDDDVDQLAIFELGLGRPRVISREGRLNAAERWHRGPNGPSSAAARPHTRAGVPATCSGCGFFLLMAGALRREYGVCSNEWSPSDGQAVAINHTCGAHSETDQARRASEWPEDSPIFDNADVEFDANGRPTFP